eukprot:6142683-Alexandrium_andersonii.AAC.1
MGWRGRGEPACGRPASCGARALADRRGRRDHVSTSLDGHRNAHRWPAGVDASSCGPGPGGGSGGGLKGSGL